MAKRKKNATWIMENSAEGPGTGRNLVDVDFARQAADHAVGNTERTYGLWGPIWKFMKWYDGKLKKYTFKKKVYLWLLVLTGWMGGHRWYQGRRNLALVETLFFWTGVPFILCLTDFMEVFPIQADETGRITM